MKKILLIDADSKIPNLALMKLSTHYKNKNYDVDLIKLNIPYFPNKRKQVYDIFNSSLYEKVFCSIIFNNNKYNVIGKNIIYGGTGYDIKSKLDVEIEKEKPDYSIYPENDISYGFISRGCIRKCKFCVVPEKEGSIHQVNNISDIIQHDKVKFLDNNFLALPNHMDILNELIERKIKCQFNQELDIRLVNKSNSLLLSKLNYLGSYFFAFDDISYLKVIKKKLKLLNWRNKDQIRFFVYVHPDMKINNIIQRIQFIKKNDCLPYVMRDISCWASTNNHFYTDINVYCNQPQIFKKMSFIEFLKKRHRNESRIEQSYKLYMSN